MSNHPSIPKLALIQSETELEERLTQPRPVLVEFIRTLASPLVILGAGGKMGPTLAVLAKRATMLAGRELEVIAVSRFTNDASRKWLEARGVKTRVADLLNRDEVLALPESANVIHLVGLKFGTSLNPSLTWAVNTLTPAYVSERYAKSKLVVLSTGNVYPQSSVKAGGALEDSPLTPVGEYANAAVVRERLFEYFSRNQGTRIALLRLNYAVELRYGVLADIAGKVQAGAPIDLTSGYFNCIWQGDANEFILRSFALAATPPAAYNLSSPAMLSVREVAGSFGKLLDRPVQFTGEESDRALISNSARINHELGAQPTDIADVIQWIAHWVKTGGRSLNKPTHFEVPDGLY